MGIITLTTDFGMKDHYVSAVKGSILKELPSVSIVDISHEIEKFNIQDAAYILKTAYPNFPSNTVHIIGLLSEYTSSQGYVALQANDHYFIGADSGIFALLFDETPATMVEIAIDKLQHRSFPARDFFVKPACLLAIGGDIHSLGKPKKELLQRIPFRAASMGDIIRGSVIYIDSYGNAITNIQKKLIESTGKERAFIIELARNYTIDRIYNDYNEVPGGEILAIFNASEQLEIALRNGKASTMLNLKLNDSITIRFL